MHLDHDVVCPTLIGRESQIAGLRRVLARGREGNGGVALIVGEAGVGKSRLLRAMADEARAAGFFALSGACFEAERSIPYAPLLDLVRLFASNASPALVAHILAPAASELVTIFPELAPLLPDAKPNPTIDPETNKRRLFHALAQVITQLARTQPVLVTFEDLHWSDDATLELLFHLARSHSAQPVVIALTYRGEEAGPRLARLVADLERARVVSELPVERLGRGDVGAMLEAIFGPRDTLGDEFLRLLHGLTEGNPFFVEETLKSLIVGGDLAQMGGTWRARPLERVRVPKTAVEAVRRRLASLTTEARDVASTAAVAGRRFDFGLLQTLTHHDEKELLALVKELIAAQLVVEESAERFAFRHALTREAIYAELLARERVTLHREVAAALERHHQHSLDGVVEALAYHAWEAADWERAAKYAARAAAHAVALSAPREAVAHLDRAFSASERAAVEPAIELYLARGNATETLGEFQRANDDFNAALARARAASSRRAEWEALYALGKLWAARDYDRAGEFRRHALDVARALGDELLVARSLNRVGNWHANLDEPQAGLPYHEEALAIFERLGDETGMAETVDLIAMAHHVGGEERAAATYYERSVKLFTSIDDRRGLANALGLLALCGPSYQSSATTPSMSPRIVEELRDQRSIHLAREIGWRAGEAFLRFIIADCLVAYGEYDRALTLAREALSQAEELEHLQWMTGTLRILGALSLDLLAPDVAREHLESAHEIAQRLGSRVWIRWTAAPLAIARARTSSLPEAIEVLDRAARVVGSAAASGVTSGPWKAAPTLGERQLWAARAEIALLEGRPDTALQIIDARLEAERAGDPASALGVPRLMLLRGEALTALERYDEAERTLETGRVEATTQGVRAMLWRIEAALGHVHRAQRKRLEARRAFDTARAIADELVAKVSDETLRVRFTDGLDLLIPPAPAPSAGRVAKEASGGLTQRERDVAELVAQGKANRIIARELGIGERTVEGYVASALGKLGFTSRTQLAAWAVEKGITRPPVANRR
jgi:DNA-binding CsgD family transcriptional regulator/tetratricopeptide (TPR) repeat protein